MENTNVSVNPIVKVTKKIYKEYILLLNHLEYIECNNVATPEYIEHVKKMIQYLEAEYNLKKSTGVGPPRGKQL